MKELIGGVVHFAGVSETVTLTKLEMENAPVTFTNKGARIMRMKSGDLITFGGTNIACVKPIYVETEDEVAPKVPAAITEAEFTKEQEEDLNQKIQEAKPVKTVDEIKADMLAKSNCKHEPEKLELYIQHTAKGVRYFPRCSFCGKRERYVSESKIVEGKYEGTPNEKWTEAHITKAKPWIED